MSAPSRSEIISSFKNDYFDVIVIGGGITGAGIALDAASRGLKVALIEKNDFASGTSSKSTKLIHGGLRYLKQYEFALVREVGKERAIVHKLAPHLVRPEKMLLPLIKNGNYGKIITSVGLMVYDVLADVESEDQRKMLSVEETIAVEPLLKKDILEGGGLYSEYQTDDFRLVIELIKKSIEYGAFPLNYVQSLEFLEKGGKICGVKALNRENDETFEIYSDYVINAGGPWADDIRSQQEKVQGKKLHLTKGVHLVVPFERLPIQQSVYFDVGDGRMIFAIPKKNITYIGTTDTDYKGDPSKTHISAKDVNYLLKAVNDSFTAINLKNEDVLSSWSGVRPLIEEEGRPASEISRKDEIFISEKGLITIAGGKLTGYRKMAKRAVSQLLNIRSDKNSIHKSLKCKTRKIKLGGGQFTNPKDVKNYKSKLVKKYKKLRLDQIDYLVDLYGSQSEQIIETVSENQKDALLIEEVKFCIKNEMVLHLTDFFIHRTGRLFFDIESVKDKMSKVSEIMCIQFGWSQEKTNQEILAMKEAIEHATTFE